MQHQTVKTEPDNWIKRWRTLLFDLWIFLILIPIGLLIIFAAAAIAMQRNDYVWLPVRLMAQSSGNYRVDAAQSLRLAPVDPKIIDAVKQDLRKTGGQIPDTNQSITETIPPATVEPTPTPEPLLELIVDAGGTYQGLEGTPIPLSARILNGLGTVVPASVAFTWDLDGDGVFDDASGRQINAVFVDEGEYPVSVRARDWLGRITSSSAVVFVTNVAPVVEIQNPGTVEEAQAISFQATAHDPGQDVLLYTWDFGDGSPPVANTLNPSHTYNDNGDYEVRLRVQDNDDGLGEDVLRVRVENSPPQVDAGEDQIVEEAETVLLRGSANDPAGDFDNLSYAWDLDFNGTFTPDVDGAEVSATYADGPTTVVAALRVRDEDGGEAFDMVNITVNNVPPRITAVSNTGPVGEGAELEVQVSATDVDADVLTYNFDWNNDGQFETTSSAPTISHIWTNQGDFTIGIQAADDDGGQVFTTTTVGILNVPPTAVALGPAAPRLEGATVQFSSDGTFDPGDDVLTYTWAFGDGTQSNLANPTHVYADNDAYTATLTVSDDSGAGDTQAVAVNILNANPTANAGADLTVNEGETLTFNGRATDPGSDDTLRYAWDFTYEAPASNFVVQDTGQTVQWPNNENLEGPATYIVALRVQDDDYPFSTAQGGEIGQHIDTLRVTVRNVPPLVEAGSYNGVEIAPVDLTGSATDVAWDILTYDWDVDNDGVFDRSGQTIAHTWPVAGNYVVTLRVTDDDGGIGFDTAPVTIGNADPTAEANGPYTTDVNLPVTLSAAGSADPTGDPLTYRWDFGDGSPPVITNVLTVTHIYLDDNIYTAILTADDGRGGSDTDTAQVTVQNLPPTAMATAVPSTTVEGGTVTFDGTGSSDPGLYDTLTYRWDFGDGTPGVMGITTTHAYMDEGLYLALLTVTDDAGDSGSDTAPVSVQNIAPTAVAVANPALTFEGSLITFDGSGSSDPGADTLAYQWNFGDGSTGSGVSLTHAYPDNAVYTAILTVTDGDGGISTATLTVTTVNTSPHAIVNITPGVVYEGDLVTFDGSGSNDPGSGDTLTYDWDFGDGTTASGVTATHTFGAEGVYTTTFRVADDDGAAVTRTTVLTVQNAAPTALAALTPASAGEGETITFDAGASTDPGGDPLSYRWDFGDGRPPAAGIVVTHAYLDDGAFTATLTVTDTAGAADTQVIPLVVANRPPTLDAGGPYSTTVGVPVQLSGSAGDVLSDTLTYAWDLNNDNTFETAGQIVTFTNVITTGTFTVTLQVDDSDGGIVTDSTTIQINSIIPISVPALLYFFLRNRHSKKKRKNSPDEEERKNDKRF